MKKIALSILFMAMTLASVAQTTGASAVGNAGSGIEDFDLITSTDYYSGKELVRSSTEVYYVYGTQFFFEKEFYDFEIINKSNNTLHSIVYDRHTGEMLNPMRTIYKPEKSEIDAMIRKVFPNCTFDDNISRKNNYISLYMAVDPDKDKVIEVKFHMHCKKGDPLLSIPPSKFRELENLINGHLTVKVPQEAKYASYSTASYKIHFTSFCLK